MAFISNSQPSYALLEEKLSVIRTLRGTPPRGFDTHQLTPLLDRLLQGYPTHVAQIPDKTKATWIKARLFTAGKREETVQGMSYKKNGGDDYGRASEPGMEVLYAARSDGTALSELGARTSDHYQLAFFGVLPGKTVNAVVIGELEYKHQSDGLSLLGWPTKIPHLRRSESAVDVIAAAVIVDAFIAEMFQRNAEGKFDYVMTTALVRALRRHSNAEVVLYPSVKHRGGLNIAIGGDVVDSSFEMRDGEYGIVDRYLDNGMLILHKTDYVRVTGNTLTFYLDDSW